MIKSILLVVLVSSVYFCQISQKSNYLKAVESLKGKDTLQALKYFKLVEHDDSIAEASIQIAMLLKNNNDYYKLNEADDYYKKAIDKDPNNIKYRLEYGKYLEIIDQKVRDDATARKKAIEQYEKIIEIDPTFSLAYYRLGKLQYNDYLDYHNSYHKDKYAEMDNYFITSASGRSKLRADQWEVAQDPKLNFEKDAIGYFEEAEKYFQTAIKNDSTLYDAYIRLAELYEESGDYDKGIDVIKNLLTRKGNDFRFHSTLALLYFRFGDMELSNKEFQKAIALMPLAEKNDFLLNTVKMFLPVILKNENSITENEIQSAVNVYWASKDPVILTDANERLVEHFARVAYANLRFGSENLKLKGWKSDRGEAIIRYGFANKKMRFRPHLEPHGIRILKTDVWEYDDFTLGFTDEYLTNQFQFSSPGSAKAISQYPGNTDDLVKLDLRSSKPEIYYPKTKGPIFNIPYKTYQFASNNRSITDAYLAFKINFEDTSCRKEVFREGYEVGLFLNDKYFTRIFESKQTVVDPTKSSSEHYNSINMKATPQNGNLAFEIIRKSDNGIAAYHGKFNVRSFKDAELQLSDLVFAKQLESGSRLVGAITRKDISIVANPTNQFTNRAQLYLYYEVYNLKTRNSITDFEQIITLQKKGSEGVLGSVLSVVGLDGKGNKVMLTSNYQTQEQDTQMYIQLDMSKYEPGNYLITVTINDKNTGKTVSANSEIEWRE